MAITSTLLIDSISMLTVPRAYHLPIQFDLSSEEAIKSKTNVIRNFLNYLLHHNVCPEFNEQIYATRNIVNQAERELWMVTQAGGLLPGRFNTACSEIFGGQLRGLHFTDLADQDWAKEFPAVASSGISPEMAKHTFKAGLIARGEQHVIEAYKKQSDADVIKVVRETATGLEVVELLPAEPEVRELYQTPVGKGLKPLGRLKARTWYFPGAPPEDLTEEEEAASATVPKEIKEYELWVEDDVLSLCFVGLKFITTIKELSFGVLYFDELRGVYASFYEMLPNDLIIRWRKVEKTWLPMREKAVENEDEDEPKDGEGDEADDEATHTAPSNEAKD